MHTTHGIHIPGTRLGNNPPLHPAQCGGVESCSDCAAEVSAIAKTGIHYPPSQHSQPRVVHISTVYSSLREAGADHDVATDAIKIMHEKGILSRERINTT